MWKGTICGLHCMTLVSVKQILELANYASLKTSVPSCRLANSNIDYNIQQHNFTFVIPTPITNTLFFHFPGAMVAPLQWLPVRLADSRNGSEILNDHPIQQRSSIAAKIVYVWELGSLRGIKTKSWLISLSDKQRVLCVLYSSISLWFPNSGMCTTGFQCQQELVIYQKSKLK